MIMIGKHKQGDVWLEGQGDVPCPEVCRNGLPDSCQQPIHSLEQTAKYSILSAKEERLVVIYILMRLKHIASYQHVLLTKHSFPVPAFAYPVRKRLTKKGADPYTKDIGMNDCAEEALDTTTLAPDRPPEVWEQHESDGHMSKLPDCPVCVEEHGFVVRHFASTSQASTLFIWIRAIGLI